MLGKSKKIWSIISNPSPKEREGEENDDDEEEEEGEEVEEWGKEEGREERDGEKIELKELAARAENYKGDLSNIGTLPTHILCMLLQ